MVTTAKTIRKDSNLLYLVLCLVSCVLCLSQLTNTVTAATTITQFGITWTFNANYTTGQFANGDYWIVGPVTITGITPSSTIIGARTVNGSMIDPGQPVSGDATQGFDSLSGGFSSSLNVARPGGNNLSISNPLVIQAGHSLISSISIANPSGNRKISDAAILTILSGAPASGSFRPPYAGTDKTITHNISEISYSCLQSLAPTANAPSLATAEGWLERPWLDWFVYGGNERYIHPTNNMPEYGADLARRIGDIGLVLNLDYTNSQKQTLMIRFLQYGIDLYGVVKNTTNGKICFMHSGGHAGGRKFPILFAGQVFNDSGMKGIGAKSGDYAYTNGVVGNYWNLPSDYIAFGEDDQTFYVTSNDVFSQPYAIHFRHNDYTPVGHASVTHGSAVVTGVGVTKWVTPVTGARALTYFDQAPTAYGYFAAVGDAEAISITGRPYKILSFDSDTQITLTVPYRGTTNSSIDYQMADSLYYGHGNGSSMEDYNEFTNANLGQPQYGINYPLDIYSGIDGWYNDESYRKLNSQCWPGLVLAARMTGLKTLWNHNALFDFVDYWVEYNTAHPTGTDTFGSVPDLGTDVFAKEMWNTYRANYGNVWSSNPENHAPVLDSIGNKSVSENSLLNFTVSATDTSGDTISYSAQGLPSGATFASRTFSWTPGYNQAGTYPVTFRASDGQATDSETIVITVSNTNRPPVLSTINSQSTNEAEMLSFTISVTDPDGDILTYPQPNQQNLPSGATFANREFKWTPNYNQAGTYHVTFEVSDGQGGTDSETITITVSNVDRPPVLNTIGDKDFYVNYPNNFTVGATDPDGDTPVYTTSLPLPSGATFANRTFYWSPSSNQVGTHTVTFYVSANSLSDDETVTITVHGADTTASQVTNLSPAADSIQAPLNSLIVLDITDTGIGVNAASVSITLDGSVIYTGDTTSYTSSSGRCSRTGTPADYTYNYQSNAAFDYDQTISVAVNASDLSGNAMSQYSYSFQTEMRSFGKNKSVNSDTTSTPRASPATIRDSSGNIYAVWHSGTADARDIYLAKLPAGQDSFSGSIQITTNSSDQCNPAFAIDTANKLYLVWQDNRSGNWDIYGSTSTDGVNWSTERKVSDSNNNEINPAIIIDKSSPQKAYVAWQDDRAGNQEIFIATSSDSFATNTVTRVTTNTANQTEPALTVTAANVVYVLWTDQRSGSADIYAAGSNSGPWSNVPVVTKSGNQTSPAIAAESAGSIVHLLWVDDSAGNRDIFYAGSNGLTGTTLNGTNIIDDASGKEQIEPAIAVTGTGSTLKVFACWQDKRNISGTSSDSDLYFVQTNSGSGTNIFVGDDSANSNQTGPAMGLDAYGFPYIVWIDDRNVRTDIYYAGSTFISSSALASSSVTTSAGVTIGTDPAAITSTDDVSIIVPVGGVSCTVTMSISRVNNPSNLSVNTLSPPYDFCPSGIVFDQPVTITIPYAVSASDQSASARWYNTLTGQLSEQGITDIRNLTISPTLRALQFQTTHFTQFVVVEAAAGSSSGGGGGCSIGAQTNPADFFLPYAGLGVVMVAIRRHDVKKHHGHNRSQ